MKKRILFAIMALVVLVTSVSACMGNGGSNDPGNDTKASGNESAAPTGENTDPSGETEPVSYEHATLTVGIPKSPKVENYEANDFTKYIEEQLNITIKFVEFPPTSQNYLRQLSLMASAPGEKMPDVIWGFSGMDANIRNEYGEAGFFLDLSQYRDKLKNFNAQFDKLDAKEKARIESRMTAESGGMYAMPLFFTVSAVDDLENMMFINKNWLDNLKLSVPTTVDELHTVLKAFKDRDANGNGKPDDEYPMFGSMTAASNIADYVINAYVYSDIYNPMNVTDGNVWASFTSNEYREALKVLNQWYKEGLIAPYSFSISDNTERMAVITPTNGVSKVGIFNGHPALVATQTSPILEEYQALAPLKAETDKGGYMVLRSKQLSFGNAITSDCENVDAALRFLDFFYLDETVTRQRHGVKDVDWYEEAGTNIFGDTDAYVNVIDSTAYFKGAKTWCYIGCGAFTSQNYFAVENFKNRTDVTVGRLLHEQIDVIQSSKVPEELCMDLVYGAEQYEEKTELASAIHPMILTARNSFINGEKDPSNDGDWNEYIQNLNMLGLEDYQNLMQEVYSEQAVD